MDKKEEKKEEPLQPDLKHDSMEYSAATDGDDIEDSVNEEEEITSEELDALEPDTVNDEANALKEAAADSQADEDNFLTSPDDKDELLPTEDEEDPGLI